MFLHWLCYRSSACRIGLWMAVASGQYSSTQANMTALWPITGPIWKHPFNNIILLYTVCISFAGVWTHAMQTLTNAAILPGTAVFYATKLATLSENGGFPIRESEISLHGLLQGVYHLSLFSCKAPNKIITENNFYFLLHPNISCGNIGITSMRQCQWVPTRYDFLLLQN